MDNVGIVVEDLDAAVAFFTELGLILEGRMPIEGEWAGRVTGLRGQRVEIAMMRCPGAAPSRLTQPNTAPSTLSDSPSSGTRSSTSNCSASASCTETQRPWSEVKRMHPPSGSRTSMGM